MISLKTCFKCGGKKPLHDFYAHKQMADGHLNKCKQCTRADVSRFRQEHPEYDRARANLPHRIEAAKRITKAWRKEYPDRWAAQKAVNYAVKKGALEKLPCWICGEKAVAHHPDYSMPLDVVWLCQAHHKQAHAMVKKAA